MSLDCGAAWDYRKNGNDWASEGVCGSASLQSPIDLPASAPHSTKELLFLKYPKLGSIPVYHNGYSIAMTMPEGFKAGFGVSSKAPSGLENSDADAFRLWQVNFHSPSEHKLKGQQMPLEVQLMHKRVSGDGSDDSEVAVVVAMFESTPTMHSEFLDAVIGDDLPQESWSTVQSSATHLMDFGMILGGSPFFNYKGSLTVPPCESHVRYFVRQELLRASQDQLAKFQQVLIRTNGPNGNFRVTQDGFRPISVMASVDLINNPNFVVRPPDSVPDAPAYVPKNALEALCSESGVKDVWDSSSIIAPSDSEKLAAAKQNYHAKSNDLRTARILKIKTGRALRSVQKMYDNSLGLSDKMSLKWQLLNAQSVHMSAGKDVTSKEKSYDEAHKELQAVAVEECVARHKKAAEEEKGEGKIKNLAEREFVPYAYPEPVVQLPGGPAASPFSADVDTSKIISSGSIDMLAPNLRQLDTPPGSADTGVGASASEEVFAEPPTSDAVLSLKLPVAPGALSKDTDSLVEALAASARVPCDRLKVAKVREISMQGVQKTPLPKLLQLQSRSRQRSSATFLSSELVSEESLK